MKKDYDVIIVGAGHAGVEAALASSRLNCKTLLVTLNLDSISFMPCNPSIGGPAKGIVVREIDALGGEMGKNVDKTFIQLRMLNTSKGPAVRTFRAQIDKQNYSLKMKKILEKTKKLNLLQGIVEDLIILKNKCYGIILNNYLKIYSKTVIITVGTFLNSKIIIGNNEQLIGPNNFISSNILSNNLKKYGLKMLRFKTGTSPRVKKSSINFKKTLEQKGDIYNKKFSYWSKISKNKNFSCWLTYTNIETHKIIKKNLLKSPLFNGKIKGIGTRYCPSIEDKIVKFNRNKHQIFLEPEGKETNEIYIQGLSTSLPIDVQLKILHSIKGLENAEIMRFGYAIEYDIIMAYQLNNTLESNKIKNLYFAGQINGTSGYEEAAAQGIIAGINAAMKINKKKKFILSRSESYIGVMIDDLVTKKIYEPYRLMTSRAEYRLMLRHDNADLRLTKKGYKIGLIKKKQFLLYSKKKKKIKEILKIFNNEKIKINLKIKNKFKNNKINFNNNCILIKNFLKKTNIKILDFIKNIYNKINKKKIEYYNKDILEEIEIHIKYEGYIKKSLEKIKKIKKMDSKIISNKIDFNKIIGLSIEGRQRLNEIKPINIYQAKSISGVTPSDLQILILYIEKK